MKHKTALVEKCVHHSHQKRNKIVNLEKPYVINILKRYFDEAIR